MNQSSELEISCRQVWKEISNYLDGDVTPALRARLERHFNNCRHCSAILDGARNTVVLVADKRAFTLPRHLGERLYKRLSEFLKR